MTEHIRLTRKASTSTQKTNVANREIKINIKAKTKIDTKIDEIESPSKRSKTSGRFESRARSETNDLEVLADAADMRDVCREVKVQDVYQGELYRDLPHGKGKLVNKEKTVAFIGEFAYGHAYGNGINLGSNFLRSGRFVGSLLEGQGTEFNMNAVYDGNFVKGVFHGRGAVYVTRTTSPEPILDNLGPVLLYGNFSDGKLHGTIIAVDRNGIAQERLYDKGRLISRKSLLHHSSYKTIYTKYRKMEEDLKQQHSALLSSL